MRLDHLLSKEEEVRIEKVYCLVMNVLERKQSRKEKEVLSLQARKEQLSC